MSLLIAAAMPVRALSGYAYGGYNTTVNWSGVKAYIRQAATASVSSPLHHADWVNVCTNSNCHQWVQDGTYQGYLPNSSSPNGVHIYWENTDPCLLYYQGDSGAPTLADDLYILSYDGTGSHSEACGEGTFVTVFNFEYRKHAFANPPFHVGRLGQLWGEVLVRSEIYSNGPTVPLGTDYYGCKDDLTCTNSAYGANLYNGTSWAPWTSDGHLIESAPPWEATFNSFWSFKTCGSSC